MARAGNFARKNFMVDAADIRTLKAVLGSASESEAVRTAVRDRILVEDGLDALRRLRARRGVEDALGRAPRRRRRP